MNKFNPQLASRLVEPMIHWKKYDKERQELMKSELQRILKSDGLSNDVYEMVDAALV